MWNIFQKRRARYPRRIPAPPLVIVIAIIILIAHRGYQVFFGPAPQQTFSFNSTRLYVVERVVDGDTLLLENGTRVRLLGVDTPETKHPHKPAEPLGEEAYEFTKRHVEGKKVTLRFDRERRDRYRRVLAYVYVDDWFLNEELIRNGFSRAETRFPFRKSMKQRFRNAEAEARKHRRGIWQQK
ncbi:MAG: hypothetical protein Tsb009_08740 [Planctomycetaceae bacterium]